MLNVDPSAKRHNGIQAWKGWFLLLLSLTFAQIASAGVSFQFPYNQNFDSGAQSLVGLGWVDGGGIATHQTTGCWKGGCVKIVPPASNNTYAGLGDFNFPASRTVHIRYLMYFGPDYVSNLITRHKHIIAHRGADESGDRGMIYVWHYNNTDFTMGACDNNDCRYEENTDRPSGGEEFFIGDHLQEWVAFEAVFDTVNHRIRLYVTTEDGSLNEHLLADRVIHSISSNDAWNRISILGAYLDWGTNSSPGMYWKFDEVAIGTSHIGPPEGFGRARPAAPSNVEAR